MSLPIADGPPLVAQFQQTANAEFAQQPVDPTAVLVGTDLTLDLNAFTPGSTQIAGAGIGISGATPSFPPICGFAIPKFLFALGFVIPTFTFPPKLPIFRLAIGIVCNLTNPLNVSFGVDWGGNRVPTFDPDPDLQLDQETGP